MKSDLESARARIAELETQLSAAQQAREAAERERDEATQRAERAEFDWLEAQLVIQDITARLASAEKAERELREAAPDFCRWIRDAIVELSDQEASGRQPHTHVDFVDQIHGLALVEKHLSALLAATPEAQSEQQPSVKLPHPDLAYKAVMARSEQLKTEGDDGN